MQLTQSARVQSGIEGICSTILMGLLSIVIDVQLGKNRSLAFWRQQRANSVNDLTIKPKRIGTTTLPIERVIQLSLPTEVMASAFL